MLADDHPLLRQALRGVLEKQPDFEVIAEASDGEEAVKLATKLLPDVVIMDISMPLLNGLEATFILVTNEVGLGLVPDNELGRRYRDCLGQANQLLARHADEVYLMVAGIPFRLN
jgi:adenosyl cobinamide kinase/adenosyl cobinamide phosphate guanylyltransferase